MTGTQVLYSAFGMEPGATCFLGTFETESEARAAYRDYAEYTDDPGRMSIDKHDEFGNLIKEVC